MGSEKVLYDIVPKNEKPLQDITCPKPKGFGVRHRQVLVLFICMTVGHTLRANLSVSMVVMTSHGASHSDTAGVNATTRAVGGAGGGGESQALNMWNVYRIYDWNKKTQEMIIFSFFVGYTSMMIPMGLLAQKFGGKKPILVALAVNGVLSLVTPWLPILGGWLAICMARLLQGMTQAALYPSMHTLLAKWAPISERGRLSTYVYTGSQFGTIVIFQMSGFFAGSPAFGWPATFWFCGVLSLASFTLLWRVGAASPHDHPTITTDEMTFILEGGSADVVPKKRRTPWKPILSSSAVWALVVTHAGSSAGYLLLLTQTPTYMRHVLGVDIKKNGLFSSLPYIAMYLLALLFGLLADLAANKNILSIVNIRKIANTIGLVVSGVFLIGFSYITSTFPAVVMLILTLGLHSAAHVGYHINHIDLAPNFAGSIMALSNMVAGLTTLTVPVVVSNLVKDELTNQQRWQMVFLIFGGFQFVTNTVFLIFAKGTVQAWNFYGEDKNDFEKEDLKTVLKKQNSVRLNKIS